ncbi:MAG TPA: NUDIX hydrolase [Rhizomicrobium sp.]|jgi:8-oxo-dGTP pyrophosphatase MutT (NUDIX family)
MVRLAAKSKPAGRVALRTQYAALPFRDEGELQVLLITSRETHRWLIPKGWPMESRQPWDSAAREALEEAGVEGSIGRTPLGTYMYDKRMAGGVLVPCSVEVYPLKVARQRKQWREKDEREQRWFTVPEAIESVQEQGLKQILRAFASSHKPVQP